MNRIYTEIANAITQYLNREGSLKTIIYTKTSDEFKDRRSFMYLLALQTLKFREVLDELFDRLISKITTDKKIHLDLDDEGLLLFEKAHRDAPLYLYAYGLHSSYRSYPLGSHFSQNFFLERINTLQRLL